MTPKITLRQAAIAFYIIFAALLIVVFGWLGVLLIVAYFVLAFLIGLLRATWNYGTSD